jgi:hypothetical protein
MRNSRNTMPRKGTTEFKKLENQYENLRMEYKEEWDDVSNDLRNRPVEFYYPLSVSSFQGRCAQRARLPVEYCQERGSGAK